MKRLCIGFSLFFTSFVFLFVFILFVFILFVFTLFVCLFVCYLISSFCSFGFFTLQIFGIIDWTA